MTNDEARDFLKDIYDRRLEFATVDEIKRSESWGRSDVRAVSEEEKIKASNSLELLKEKPSPLISNLYDLPYYSDLARSDSCVNAAYDLCYQKENVTNIQKLGEMRDDVTFMQECMNNPIYKEAFCEVMSGSSAKKMVMTFPDLPFMDRALKKVGIKTKKVKQEETERKRFDEFVNKVSAYREIAKDGTGLNFRLVTEVKQNGNLSRYDEIFKETMETETRILASKANTFCNEQARREAYNLKVNNINESNKDNHIEKISHQFDAQFRDTDFRKTNSEKTAVAKDRYLARKILKDRGLLSVSKNKVVNKTELSQTMLRKVSQRSENR